MEPTGAAPLRPTDLREIGPYRLLGRLGEGGMGTVFLARAPSKRFVALKVVKAEFANQEGFAARFHAEVENARRVASFCTAQVLDNGNTGDGRPFMVTEYIAGTPLSDQINRYGALDQGALHGVALGVAAALAAIHVAGLVHRDLKPANVILSLSGPRVIDFGISRALDQETGFTMSGELIGSPGWWAPEQVRGEAISPAVDIFSWGCLVAYAGNGRHPYGRGDAITLATRVLNDPPDLGTLPAPLDELVRRATSQNVAERPTAQDLLIALVGGSAPVRADDPPTLVATEMLSGWQPPRNVVDEPDITATFSTPPPSDATGKGQSRPPAAFGAQFGGTPGEPISLEDRARLEEAAAREELARWEVPQGDASARDRREDGRGRRLFRSGGKKGRKADQEQPRDDAPQPQPSPGPGATVPPGSPQTGQVVRGLPQTGPTPLGASQTDPGRQELSQTSPVRPRPSQPGRAQTGPVAQPGGPQTGPARTGPSRPGPAAPQGSPQTGPMRAGSAQTGPAQGGPVQGFAEGASAQAGAARTDGGTAGAAPQQAVSPVAGDEPEALPRTRTSGTRWLMAAAAAVLAVVVAGAVLIANSGGDTTTPAASQAGTGTAATDVGRRFALGGEFDDPVAIITAAPQCGLRQYEGTSTTKGQLCVIPWSMVNPGGESRTLTQPTVSMLDDRGAEHDAEPVVLPPAIQPGGRVDSVFVFDLPLYRKPVSMTASMLENGQQIEVKL
ncbi:Serine/threonine protein kinase [Nonomuraea maritima]|uniref:Serine/threonine protein kinase n=2 Tax=Nonomuraea maritima TaxID=683260 RepID=A0A1G8UCC8_9ACTN|nr:protein kinase [Nonomuraea maritima]SDJ51413.1 Serine/threonine protein kinase [Nonomuraea maritima]